MSDQYDAPNTSADEALDVLFNPRSVVIVGASEDRNRIGGRPLRYMLEAGFKGDIYPVNPKRASVQGLPAYADIASIPGCPELALVILPAQQVPDTITELGRKGVRVTIIFSSGFAEISGDGRGLQQRLLDNAAKTGMRLLGPNCLGAFNALTGFYGTFTQAFDSGGMTPGSIGVVSQSGAAGGHLAYLFRRRNLGISYLATTGNEADIELAECIRWQVRCDDVKVVAVFAEAIRNGPAFIEALALARDAGKPIVMIKVGRSASGARAATSHTGAMVGTDEVYDAVLRQYGAIRAGSLDELIDVVYACQAGLFPAGNRLAVVTGSGGFGIQAVDAAENLGLDTPRLSDSRQAQIREWLPFAGTENPIDVTAQAINEPDLIGRCLDVTLGGGEFDSLICFLASSPAVSAIHTALLDALRILRAKHPDKLIVLVFSAPADIVCQYEIAGFPVFEDVNRAVTAIANLTRFAASAKGGARLNIGRLIEVAPRVTPTELGAACDEAKAKALLARAGVPSLPERVVADGHEARAAAVEVGCPVALKILSPDIQHKTEIGGVVLNVATPEEAESEAQALLTRVALAAPHARISGLLVTPMRRGGIETICGVFIDPVFGPVILFGLGGVHAEVWGDVAFRLAPFDHAEAASLIAETRAGRILNGIRGAPPSDVEALIEVLVRLSAFAVRNRDGIREIDINPLVVMPRGEGVFALDALIVPAAVPSMLEERSNAHAKANSV